LLIDKLVGGVAIVVVVVVKAAMVAITIVY